MFTLHRTERFDKWLVTLKDRLGAAQILRRMKRLESGHFGDVKTIGDGVSELRIHSGPGYRVYYCQRGTQIILLLCGGDKGSQESDIRLARSLAKDIPDGDHRSF
ncbi:type II toxin-antitoxin system RelE/ParE family toxin [Asticcacaulis excentricus]|uniref:Phage-related protein n=1 Tax=Asticcacaulis excentricus TaxID=78587 RepID=A0A3G9G6W5_9CAUL|nr:type II toxin-antitoxin system RelE/ParE family toxin [Asticcacaulis excentricus]BBF80764.1 phage-related protein [Asticcacaulis excentricus]